MADVLIAWVRRLLPDLTGKSPKLRSYTDLIVREILILKEKSWRDRTCESLCGSEQQCDHVQLPNIPALQEITLMVDFTKCELPELVPADRKILIRGWSRFCLVYFSTTLYGKMRWNRMVWDLLLRNWDVLPQHNKDTSSIILLLHKMGVWSTGWLIKQFQRKQKLFR